MEFSIAPTIPAAVETRDDSAGKCRAEKNENTTVRRDDAYYSPSSTGDVPAANTLDVSTRTPSDDRISDAPPSRIDASFPGARSARRMARHALITAGKVAEARAADTVTAAPSLHGPEFI